MWLLLTGRLRRWLLLVLLLPLARMLVHRLAVAAEQRRPQTRTARALRQADSAMTTVTGRAARRPKH